MSDLTPIPHGPELCPPLPTKASRLHRDFWTYEQGRKDFQAGIARNCYKYGLSVPGWYKGWDDAEADALEEAFRD